MSLSYQRSRFTSRLADTCVVEVPGEPVSDGKGGRTPGAPTDVSYPCTLRARSGQTQLVAGDRELVRGAFVLRLPYDAVAQEGWFVRVLGQRLKVVWAPPAGTAARTRQIGVDLP